jgi:hypothetical protein
MSTGFDDSLFDFGRKRRRFTDEELLADLRAFAAVFGSRQRTAGNYRDWEGRRFHDRTICDQLGGWIEALRRAGVEYDARGSQGPTADEVEADIRRFAKATPVARRTFAEFREWPRRRVSAHAVKRHFGPWHAALTHLGIEVPGQTRSVKHSDEELLDAIWRVWQWAGRPPSKGDFDNYSASRADGISYGAIHYRFGPVRPFLFAFSRWKLGQISKRDLLMHGHAERARREPVPPGIRHRLLRAAHSTCAICGRSPANTRGLVVHVDHIVPVSKGGSSDESNLQVLCAECNIGKGPQGRARVSPSDIPSPERKRSVAARQAATGQRRIKAQPEAAMRRSRKS